MSRQYTNADRADILNRLALTPNLKQIARDTGIHPTTIFEWRKRSLDDPDAWVMEWAGFKLPFHVLLDAARALNKSALDHRARDLALNGHSEPLYFQGAPVWKQDPKRAADAKTFTEGEWSIMYPEFEYRDVYARDHNGALVQEVVTHPPNPQVLNKVLAALIPETFGERAVVEHHHSGSVWVEGASTTMDAKAVPGPGDHFALTDQRAAEQALPTNVLAIPRPCANSDEFDAKFRRKLLREVTLFYDRDKKVRPPLADDVVVAGSRQHRIFEDAAIMVQAVRAEDLLDEGFQNDFLKELAPPGYKPKPPPPKPNEPPPLSRDEAAKLAAEKIAQRAVPIGKASAEYNAERLGHGTPLPGGRSVVR